MHYHAGNSMNAIDAFLEQYAWRDLTDDDLKHIADDASMWYRAAG